VVRGAAAGLSLAYAVLRRLHPAQVGVAVAVDPRSLITVAAAIAVGSFVVRIWSQLGADTFANLRWEAWPQGAGLFALGVLAGERGWLGAVDRQLVRRCGWATVAAMLGLAALAVWALVADRGDVVAGGVTGQSATLAVLEGLGAMALSLWVVAWFRRRWDRHGRLVERAGRGSYGAYVLHPPVLVALSLLARPLPVVPEAKFVLVAMIGVVAAFALGVGLTRLRVLTRLL
jgi:glucans biosynthesis protein C